MKTKFTDDEANIPSLALQLHSCVTSHDADSRRAAAQPTPLPPLPNHIASVVAGSVLRFACPRWTRVTTGNDSNRWRPVLQVRTQPLPLRAFGACAATVFGFGRLLRASARFLANSPSPCPRRARQPTANRCPTVRRPVQFQCASLADESACVSCFCCLSCEILPFYYAMNSAAVVIAGAKCTLFYSILVFICCTYCLLAYLY